MSSSTLKSLKLLLILILFILFNKARAQDKYKQISNRIDSLAGIGLPKSALKEVDNLEILARENKNAAQQIRAVIYRMTFQSYLEEQAYPAIISRLKQDVTQAQYPAKPVLQSLLADMYWKYYQQNRYRISQRTQQLKADTDFTNWDLKTVIKETSRLYKLSLADARKEQNTPINILDGVLQGDTATRYLRPTLYDLLLQRALDFYLTDEASITKPRLPFSLNDPAFFGDSRTFAALSVKTTDTTSTYYQGIKYLQQATAFHLQMHQDEALADIDLQRLKFLYGSANVEHKDSLYLSALRQIAILFAAKPISTEALVLEGQYYQNKDSLVIAHKYFEQAIASYPQSLGGKNAAELLKVIEQKELSAAIEEINIPGKPMLALLNYRNITTTDVAVYRLSASQLKPYNSGDTLVTLNQFRLNFLRKLKPLQTQELKWVNKRDFQRHSAEFKIDGLSPGNYVLMVNNGLSTADSLTAMTNFRISSIAYMARQNPDNNIELRVMDRESGKPLSGVKVNLKNTSYTYNNTTKKQEVTQTKDNGLTDKNGRFVTDKFTRGNNMSVALTLKGDTLFDESKYINGASDQSDDDDDPEDKTVLFTDRQIYRPGQTIYFKGLQLQTFKGKSKIMPGKAVEVDFMDVNNKQVSLLKFKANEFGSFNGSFIIPQAMLGGDVTLKTSDGEIQVKVEEYKRPTFQVEFLPVKQSYKLNDSVMVKGRVLAFSGYGLSQASVAYHITRMRGWNAMSYAKGRALYGSRFNYNNSTAEIKTDTILTDNQGNFTVKFKATPDEAKDKDATYTYTINADVTDQSDETHSGETTVNIGDNDIKIVNMLSAQQFAKDTYKVPVSITNLNGEPEKGSIKVEIYALQNPDQLFTQRLWSKPDQYLLDKNDFKASFPDYAYCNEDEASTWARTKLISSYNFNADTNKVDSINLDQFRKQASGIYQVVISARNEKGDTTSVTSYVSLIADQPKPNNSTGWVISMLNSVKPGQNAEFLVGLGQKTNVLMELYHQAKLISSKWITIDKGQQSIKLPVADTDKDVAVQFMTVYHNRAYNSYQKIFISTTNNDLKIKFLTFHNKLQPGEKEQWKLQVSGSDNEKQVTEMVAALYDASLDDITEPQDWQHVLDIQEKYQPNYFTWESYGFVNAAITNPVNYMYNSFSIISRNYEQLNLFGYDYYGSYNNAYNLYLNQAKQNLSNAQRDKQLQEAYLKNAAKVKNGYDVTGIVKDAQQGLGLPGVSVMIKGSNISTTTSSTGSFRIKVPVGATLIFKFIGYKSKEISTEKAGSINVILEAAANQLGEVLVVGYGVQRKASLGYSIQTVRIRGVASLPAAASEVLEGKAAGVQVMNIYGNQNNDKVVMRELMPNPPITIRNNFNETAFFYPQLRTDDKGQILVEFTIPDALTRWRFKAFAHNKTLQVGYIQNDVVTQKQLSISANMPRFLREGDTLTVSARLANLTAVALKGKVTVQLFNALTMQPVFLLLNKADTVQQFEVGASSNKAISFKLVIPQGLDALTYRLTADAGNYSDGEENTLPVLPNRMLVTESMPMMVRSGQTRDFTFDKLVNHTSTTLKSKTLTLEYTENPAWYAVQAMPYLMEFPYECSEQVFSRYYANSLATSLVNHMPIIKRVFEQWKSTNSTELLSNLEKSPELKSTLLEETPWLQNAISETEQKKRIALLFDVNKMSDELKTNLDKLQKRQLADGGFTWFGGDVADQYITQHIVAGIGQLYHLKIANENDQELKEISDKAINYMDDRLIAVDKETKKLKGYETRDLSAIEIHAWYARSFYLNNAMSADLKSAFINYMQRTQKQWVFAKYL